MNTQAQGEQSRYEDEASGYPVPTAPMDSEQVNDFFNMIGTI